MTATATATRAACVGCDQPATRVVHYRVDREARARRGTFCDRCAEEVEALWPAHVMPLPGGQDRAWCGEHQPKNVAPARRFAEGEDR